MLRSLKLASWSMQYCCETGRQIQIDSLNMIKEEILGGDWQIQIDSLNMNKWNLSDWPTGLDWQFQHYQRKS